MAPGPTETERFRVPHCDGLPAHLARDDGGFTTLRRRAPIGSEPA